MFSFPARLCSLTIPYFVNLLFLSLSHWSFAIKLSHFNLPVIIFLCRFDNYFNFLVTLVIFNIPKSLWSTIDLFLAELLQLLDQNRFVAWPHYERCISDQILHRGHGSSLVKDKVSVPSRRCPCQPRYYFLHWHGSSLNLHLCSSNRLLFYCYSRKIVFCCFKTNIIFMKSYFPLLKDYCSRVVVTNNY